MDSLAREICQNSLDARRRDLPADEPVRVEFRLVEIRKDDHHDVFGGYEEALRGRTSTGRAGTTAPMRLISSSRRRSR